MATTKKTTAKKTASTTAKKSSAKKTPARQVKKAEVVDFEPNKMGFAVASLAAVTLVLLGLIAMSN